MPSENVTPGPDNGAPGGPSGIAVPPPAGLPPVAPPSGRLMLQLFLVPGLIVAFLVVMWLSCLGLFGTPYSKQGFLDKLNDPNAEYNRLFQRQRSLPDGPERMQVMTRMKEILVAYMPYKAHVHRIWTDLAQPWVVGYHRNVFLREFWRYIDIDPAEKARRTQ